MSRLEEARENLRRAVETVPSELRNRRPGEDRWAVNDVLEHLSMVETLWAKRLGDAIATAREAGLGSEQAERVPLAESVAAVIVDRSTRRNAPDAARPGGGLDNAAAWTALETSRRRLVNTILEADGLALSEVFTSHPAFGAMSIYQGCEFLAGHETRHTAQVVEIGAQLASL